MDNPYLVNDAGVQFGLRPNFATQIGRDGDNDIIVGDSTVSAHHATITPSDGRFRVHDLNSSNGTLINGKRISDAVLTDGDLVQFGRIKFTFRNISLPAIQALCYGCRQPLRPGTSFCSKCGADQRSGFGQNPSAIARRPAARVVSAPSPAPPIRLKARQAPVRRKKRSILKFFGVGLVLFLMALPFLPFLLFLYPTPSNPVVSTATPDQSSVFAQILIFWNLLVAFPIYGFFWRWGKRILVYLFLKREAYSFADHVVDRAKD
jgi:hypothetical protein